MTRTRRFVLTGLAATAAAGCAGKATGGGASDGTDGLDGSDGVDGVDGTSGADGLDGSDGTDGADGTDGGVDCDPTPSDVEGPYYTPGAPEVAALADDDEPGQRILIQGSLVEADDCVTPRAGWVIDLWHADDAGEYDNVGYHLRGRVITATDGAFVVETILPGKYSTRPVRHIHFKLRRPDGSEALTSQIYFPDEDYNPDAHPGPAVELDGDGEGTLLLAI